MNDSSPRRHRRSKADIIASIQRSAIEEISEKGFLSALVTNIIKKADIEPQVFYNRYKDINDFYDDFVHRYDNSVAEVLDAVKDPFITKSGFKKLLREILRYINEDPVALELLRWEVSDKNPTTTRSAMLRELNFQPLTQGFLRCFDGEGIDIIGIFTILVGGIYYISLHKKLAPFFAIDVESKTGRKRVGHALDQVVNMIFDAKLMRKREQEIARRLRELGVSDAVIEQAIGIDPDESDT